VVNDENRGKGENISPFPPSTLRKILRLVKIAEIQQYAPWQKSKTFMTSDTLILYSIYNHHPLAERDTNENLPKW
jgi:hypothetical protein